MRLLEDCDDGAAEIKRGIPKINNKSGARTSHATRLYNLRIPNLRCYLACKTDLGEFRCRPVARHECSERNSSGPGSLGYMHFPAQTVSLVNWYAKKEGSWSRARRLRRTNGSDVESPSAERLAAVRAYTCLDYRPRMHELSLVESVKEIALRHARMERASRILSIRLVIGDLSSYIEEAVVMFWDEISRDTDAAGARLDFVHIPGELLCLHCLKSFTAWSTDLRCPNCRSEWVKPVAGDDCYIESIEVEAVRGPRKDTSSLSR